jgi:hypothetical protein
MTRVRLVSRLCGGSRPELTILPTYELPTATCGGSSITFTQIAAKNNVVYGLTSSGTVWAPSTTADCWVQFGGGSHDFTSIATDNGNETRVWASDSNGNIWTGQ